MPQSPKRKTAKPDSPSVHGANSIDRIIQAAVVCFSKHGYEGASMQQVADLAGVSKSLLHYHFHSKEELMIRAITEVAQKVVADLELDTLGRSPSVAALIQAADKMFDLVLSRRENGAFMTELCATANHNDTLREPFKLYLSAQREMILNVIRTAMGKEQARARLPAKRLALLVETWLLGITIQRVFSDDLGEIRQIFEDMKTITLQGALKENSEF